MMNGKELVSMVSVIIPVYRRTEWLKKNLENCVQQSYAGAYEIIIADDGSPNAGEIVNIIGGIVNPRRIQVTYNRMEHAGPAATRNFGVRAAEGNVLCFLDDDSIPDLNWLSEIVAGFRTSTIGSVSGRTLSLDREFGLPLMLERAVYTVKGWATCNIAYRREVFESLGGFDETFSEPSWEDNDLGFRAHWAGYRHVVNVNAIVYHPHEKTMDEYKQKCRLNGRGAAAFSKKYLFRRPLWGLGVSLIMSRYLLFATLPQVWMKNINSPVYLKFIWSLYSFQGYWKALLLSR